MKFKFLFFFIVAITSVIAQKVYIPDANFRQYLTTNHPQTMNGDSLIISEAKLVSDMYCINQGVANFEGLQYFTGLYSIDLRGNVYTYNIPDDTLKLPPLDSLVNLFILDISQNDLYFMPDISNLIGLTTLNVSITRISQLSDLSNNTNLHILNVRSNNLTALPNLSHITSLINFNCSDNQLTSLPDLPGFIATLRCDFNQLTQLPSLNNLTQLMILAIHNNQLTSLPSLNNNWYLQSIHADHNQLTSLPDLSYNTQLTILSVEHNQLTSLPSLDNLTYLENLDCAHNKLNTLPDLSNLIFLDDIECQHNLLTSLPNVYNPSGFRCDHNKLDYTDADDILTLDGKSNMEDLEFVPQNPFGQKQTKTLIINQNGSINISAQPYADSYQWYKNGVAIQGAITNTLTFTNVQSSDAGVYTCEVFSDVLSDANIDNGDGTDSFISETITVRVAQIGGKKSEEYSDEEGFTIYPNPASGYVNIDINETIKKIYITSLTGQNIELDPSSRTINLNDLNLSSGTYNLTMETENGIFNQPLIIKK